MPTCLACRHTDADHWAVGLDEEYFTTDDPFTYYQCQKCEALFIDPVPRNQLNIIYPANYYSFDEQVTGSFVFKIKDWLDQRFFRKYISKLPQKKIHVLDVGGGTGKQLLSLLKVDDRITRTVIVDLNEDAGEVARQQGLEYFCGRFENYVSDEPFDVILMLNLIEHVDNPAELLAKAQSLLSPEGIVIVKTPNTDSLDARLFRHRNWGGYHCPRHWVLFNENNFKSIVQKTGLKIGFFKYTQGAPFWTTSILYALGRRKWIRVSKERPVPKHPLYPVFNIFFACTDLLRGQVAKTSQMFAILKQS
ncbi:MAG: class I SAM-dependent methyltransferase [Rhodothermales bacterium]